MQGADEPARAASAADVAPAQGRPARLVVVIALAWLAAILCARLLLAGGTAWVVFGLLVPIVLSILWRMLGLLRAVLLLALFVAATLGLRVFLTTPRVTWALLLLGPVLAFSGYLALRVMVSLRTPRQA